MVGSRIRLLALCCGIVADGTANEIILPPRPVIVDQVWSGHPVDFALVDGRRHYFIAYYDAQRRMTVASLPIGGSTFTYQKLDSVTGWDSHNYLAMAEDVDGHLHVIGNLHNDPLVYFRTTRAGDVSSFERVNTLVNPARERRMTYPVFIQRRDRSLVLKYRDGGSGNGNEIYVAYDAPTRRWRSLLDTPLVDGEGRRNAYFVGPTTGPDGRFHLTWVWRDSPDAETNHDLSYARSADLVHWEKSDGTPLRLPITLAAAEIVDPVPVRGGMINNNTVVGFDNAGRPVITYHKFDEHGNTQIFLARREKQGWRIVQLTDWRNFRWDFGGRGSLVSRLKVGRLFTAHPHWQELYITRDDRTYQLRVRSRDLKLLQEAPFTTRAEAFANTLELPAGMVWNTVSADGSLALIAWPTLPRNRDQPRSEIPPPTPLVLGLPGAARDPR